jgi:hypothetical protein
VAIRVGRDSNNPNISKRTLDPEEHCAAYYGCDTLGIPMRDEGLNKESPPGKTSRAEFRVIFQESSSNATGHLFRRLLFWREKPGPNVSASAAPGSRVDTVGFGDQPN